MKITATNKEVEIPVTIKGEGHPIVFCPGLSFTQPDWQDILDSLQSNYQVITFDLRGHGLSSSASDYSFNAFLGDVEAVFKALEKIPLAQKPILVGYSLGADLALHYAAENADTIAQLIIIDGANPLPEPFIRPEDKAMFKAQLESPEYAEMLANVKGTPRQSLLSPQNMMDINMEIDVKRSQTLPLYHNINCPITMIMSDKIAGNEDYSQRLNVLWHSGIKRLTHEYPNKISSVTWLDADHQLVSTHAVDIAKIIDATAN